MFIFVYDLKEHTKRKNNKDKLMSSREQDRAGAETHLQEGNTLCRLAFHYLPALFQLTINPKYKIFKDLA